MTANEDYVTLLRGAMRSGDVDQTLTVIRTALEGGLQPLAIVDQGLIPAIRNVGELFERGDLFLPHLMRAAESMKKGMALLSPHLVDVQKVQDPSKTVILGTVEGEALVINDRIDLSLEQLKDAYENTFENMLCE